MKGLIPVTFIILIGAIKKGINKRVIDKFKDELGGNILSKFVGLRVKTYSYC